METEIVPEPTPEEREAILAALADSEPVSAGADAWRRAALEHDEE